MTKIYTVLFAFVVLLDNTGMTAPIEGDIITEEKDSVYNFMDQKLSEELVIAPTRYVRATCRIPIIRDWISDSACAAVCIVKGKSGGHCRNEICHCREGKVLDLQLKRCYF